MFNLILSLLVSQASAGVCHQSAGTFQVTKKLSATQYEGIDERGFKMVLITKNEIKNPGRLFMKVRSTDNKPINNKFQYEECE